MGSWENQPNIWSDVMFDCDQKNGIQPIASTEESNRVGAYQWISVADIRISDIRT